MSVELSATTADLPEDGMGGYSRVNAERFGWSSVSGDLNPERVAHLEAYATGDTVLDAGCGGGAFVDFLSRQGLNVTGVDLHATFLTIGQERGYQGRFVQGDITALPFGDKEFDFTYCFDVLEHVDDQAAIRELARVTRKRILLAVPRKNQEFAPYNLTFLHYQDTTHLRYYDEDYLTRLAETVAPQSVRVFSELNVGLGEMVRTLTHIDRDALKARIATVLAGVKPTIRAAMEDADTENAAINDVQLPSYPVQGIRSRLRAAAVANPQVQQHFRDSYRNVAAHYIDHAGEQAEQYVAKSTQTLADQIAETVLFEATYATIPTGLVAVIDL